MGRDITSLKRPRPTFSKLLRKISGRFLILRQSWTISGEALISHNFALLIRDLTTTSHNDFQQDVKIKELITIIIVSLFPNSRLVRC